jgi:hypothetical protein
MQINQPFPAKRRRRQSARQKSHGIFPSLGAGGFFHPSPVILTRLFRKRKKDRKKAALRKTAPNQIAKDGAA